MSVAQDFVGRITAFGVNLERTNAINYGFNKDPAAWDTLKANGCGGIARMFVPLSPTINFGLPQGTAIPTTVDELAPYFDAAALGNARGVPTKLEFLDVSNLSDWNTWRAAILAFEQMAATEAARRGFDPKMATFGPCNEWAGETNAAWQDIINATAMIWANTLSADFTITLNCGGWGGISNYADGTFVLPPGFPAERALFQVHDYSSDAQNPAHWTSIKQTMDAFCAKYPGSAWTIGEAGFAGVNGPFGYDAAGWPKVIAAVAQAAPRSAATFWSMTSGNDFRMNSDPGKPALHGELIPAFQAAAKIVAAQASTGPGPITNNQASTITVSDPGTVVAGASVKLSVKTSPPLKAIDYAFTTNDATAGYPFYDGATQFSVLPLAPDGTGSITFAPRANGDFVKFGQNGQPFATYKDTKKATVIAASPLPAPTPVPVQPAPTPAPAPAPTPAPTHAPSTLLADATAIRASISAALDRLDAAIAKEKKV